MLGGGKEPMYFPGSPTAMARLIYREDYASSALHEAAHWCIAGSDRRKQIDFDYVYFPPPRTYREQQQFFRFEERVQALEWIFSDAAGIEFHPSADNLAVGIGPFKKRLVIAKEALTGRVNGAGNTRSRAFRDALAEVARLDLPKNNLVDLEYG